MILKPFELIYHLASEVKNNLYDNNWLPSKKLNVPVISIGNLSFGGTGKTPFIEFLANEFVSLKKVVIICRSYKANLKGPQRIDLNLKNAVDLFGDEACLLQKNLPECKVWSGPQKYKTAIASLVDQPSLILVDDGFSHRQLQRNFDIVLFDSSKLESEYYREKIKSLHRAHAIILTKVEPNYKDSVRKFAVALSEQFPALANSIFESQMNFECQVPSGSSVHAFCGIANPKSFLKTLVSLSYEIIGFDAFADHQPYSEELQIKILQRFESLKMKTPSLRLVTTEKDAVKLRNNSLVRQLSIVRYKVLMSPEDKVSLFEKIRSVI